MDAELFSCLIFVGVLLAAMGTYKVKERRAEVRARKVARSMANHPAGKGLAR